ncbi:MAG: 2OG-Fe(II) oxygenase [Flavobacteriia bacterium]|nr:2OG-Fe(II) oxygenase [Flavobacteriia bacterium]
MNHKVCDAVTYVSLFTKEECQQIIAIGNDLLKEEGKLQHKDGRWAKGTGRNCRISWLHNTTPVDWVFKKLRTTCNFVNDQFYGFNLIMPSSAQFTEYRAFQKYDWHFDNGAVNDVRLLACVVNLQNAIIGGGTEIRANGWMNGEEANKVGATTFFPCYLLHRAKKVWLGTRYSLVFWANGKGKQ